MNMYMFSQVRLHRLSSYDLEQALFYHGFNEHWPITRRPDPSQAAVLFTQPELHELTPKNWTAIHVEAN